MVTSGGSIKIRRPFQGRKRLYKFILNGMERGKTAQEMIETLENKRLYKDDEDGEVKKRTIGWLQRALLEYRHVTIVNNRLQS